MMDVLPTLKRLLDQIRVHDRNLEDQIRRAATSVILNHAEADGVRGGHRKARILTAHGSLTETRVGIQVAAGWSYISRFEADEVDRHLDKVAALTWRRLHPR